MENAIFEKLFQTLEDRKSSGADSSYVASLYEKGTKKINAKILEEAQEVCEAALENDKTHLIHELCDLLFHSFVQAAHNDITLDELKSELTRRFGTSGHDEKASRQTS